MLNYTYYYTYYYTYTKKKSQLIQMIQMIRNDQHQVRMFAMCGGMLERARAFTRTAGCSRGGAKHRSAT